LYRVRNHELETMKQQACASDLANPAIGPAAVNPATRPGWGACPTDHRQRCGTATLLAAALLLSVAAPFVMAAELGLLGGYQFNSDFEVAEDATLDELPPTAAQPGTAIPVDDGTVLAAFLDFGLGGDPTDRLGLYASRQRSDIGVEAGLRDPGLTVYQVHLVGTKLYPMGRWEPFVLAGVGATLFEPADGSLQSNTEFSLQLGGGAYYKLGEAVRLRFDARWVPSITGTDVAGICSGGCVIATRSDIYSQVQVNAGIAISF
jgi:opacity protein-like surface antigen